MARRSPRGPITVAAFNFGESKILANMYADVLKKAGFDASVKALGAREIVEPALEKGSADGGVDVVPEYLSTFTEFLNTKENGKNAAPKATPDVNATLAAAQELAGKVGITVLTPSAAADENAFAVTKDFADEEQPEHAVRPRGLPRHARPGRTARVPAAPVLRARAGDDVRHPSSPASPRSTPAAR